MVHFPNAAIPHPTPSGHHEQRGSQETPSQIMALAQLTARAETGIGRDRVRARIRYACANLLVWNRPTWRTSSAFEKDEDRMHPQEMSSQLETLCKRLATLKEGL